MAIVGHANMTFGTRVGELLDRCLELAPDRFRGVRHVTLDYPDERPFRFVMTYRPPAGLLESPCFRLALAELQKRGLSFDAAVFDPSLPRLTELIDGVPDLTVVLNHAGIAVGVDMTPDERSEVFRRWSTNLRDLARRPNVVCKISGFGMPNWGFGFHERRDAVTPPKISQPRGVPMSRPPSKRSGLTAACSVRIFRPTRGPAATSRC